MKTPLGIACLLAAASSQAGWFPDSPILQVGDDLDIYFTAKARYEYESNIFLGSNPQSGTSWTLGPGFTADLAKEANFSSSFTWRRDFVRYFSSGLKGLNDERDVGGAAFTYDGGGPLTFQLQANYGEDARNTDESSLITGDTGTLLRSTNYSQSATLGYRFTEKLVATLQAVRSSNRYDPVLVTPATPGSVGPPVVPPTPDIFNTEGLVESDGWTFPFDVRYQIRERLNIGLAYEHGHTNLSSARGSSSGSFLSYGGFTKDFYGITLSGQPTSSGKLDTTLRVGLLRTSFDGGAEARSSASYSLGLTHTLTEKLNHSLTIADNANVAINGARSRGQSANYTLNYVMNEGFRASAYVGFSNSLIERLAFAASPTETTVRSGSYGINATYSPDTHWTYIAGYTLTQTYEPNSYNLHRFSLEANLRW